MPGDGMAAFESSIGLRLPSDYKAYIDEYGVGCINECFWVRHPTAAKGAFNLLRAPEEYDGPQDDEEFLSTHLTVPPLPLGVGRDRLMLCADSDGGEFQLYWQTTDDDPDRWPVVLGNDDGDGWDLYDLTMVEFLLALFTHQLPELASWAEAGYVTDEIEIRGFSHVKRDRP